jgi:hypothetical protein
MYTMYMALHINNPEIENEVRTLALERGQTITDLIGTAVKVLRAQPKTLRAPRPTVEEILQLIRSFPEGPVDYSLTEDEILGYGPNGYSE